MYEKMANNRGSYREQRRRFLDAWKRAGYPKNFRCNGNFQQIMDQAARREKLEMLAETAEQRRSRLEMGALEYRRRLMEL